MKTYKIVFFTMWCTKTHSPSFWKFNSFIYSLNMKTYVIHKSPPWRDDLIVFPLLFCRKCININQTWYYIFQKTCTSLSL
jgi:hypothetical protein